MARPKKDIVETRGDALPNNTNVELNTEIDATARVEPNLAPEVNLSNDTENKLRSLEERMASIVDSIGNLTSLVKEVMAKKDDTVPALTPAEMDANAAKLKAAIAADKKRKLHPAILETTLKCLGDVVWIFGRDPSTEMCIRIVIRGGRVEEVVAERKVVSSASEYDVAGSGINLLGRSSKNHLIIHKPLSSAVDDEYVRQVISVYNRTYGKSHNVVLLEPKDFAPLAGLKKYTSHSLSNEALLRF